MLSDSYLKEYLILKVFINSKERWFASLKRSPRQIVDEFDSFIPTSIYSYFPDFIWITGAPFLSPGIGL